MMAATGRTELAVPRQVRKGPVHMASNGQQTKARLGSWNSPKSRLEIIDHKLEKSHLNSPLVPARRLQDKQRLLSVDEDIRVCNSRG